MKKGLPEDSWRVVLCRFRRNRFSVAGLILLFGLFALALLADFIANDKPIIMKYQRTLYSPVVESYAVSLGVSGWPRNFQNISFKDFARENFRTDDWAIFPPVRYSPTEVNLLEATRSPSRLHLLGTDEIGRDVASRMIHGTRVSLWVGFVAVTIYVTIGLVLGGIAGFYGGAMDVIISRSIEIMLTMPTFFVVITIVAFLRQSIFNMVVVIAVTNWPTIARLTRGEILKLKSLEYVLAARALGARDFRTIFRHLLPNAMAPILVAATFGIATSILLESALSFLGLGVPPSTPSWGSVLESGRVLLPSAWWLTAFPGLAIFLTVTSYNLVGEGLREAADPRLKL